MVPIKIRKFGNSLGMVLPDEVIHRLNIRNGEQLFLVETIDGGYPLTPYDPLRLASVAREFLDVAASALAGRFTC
jgi:antitoxin component of MazEF toxin-antitoxin module